MITITANQYALENLVYRPMRRLGIDTINFGVLNSQGRQVGLYDPAKNQLRIAPQVWNEEFSLELREALKPDSKTIILATGCNESREFGEWLTNEGHTVHFGGGTHQYVDGAFTGMNEKAKAWLDDCWEQYCSGC